ncbi:MAG: 2-oxoisovalerate dehydrogenase component alpha subunit [Acidimicrobiaceae bacterium]|jgi:2-oxoisovalerate dehydrogenase E1 component alpha subunit
MLDDAQLVQLHHQITVTRVVDERLWALSRQGRAGFVLTARGHEVAQVASTMAMRIGHDSGWPYYRDLGVGIAMGVSPYEVFLGALRRESDPHSGGRQLTAHFSSAALRLGSISSEVGAHLPHAVGAAYASRVLGDDAVAMCWFGDGAASEGAAHEAMNFAGVHRLPVVFVCENNGLAISVPVELQMAAPVAARAPGYGMEGVTLDGTDPDVVFDATTAAIEHARRGDGPSLLELLVPRIVPHSSQDDDSYRSDAERAAAATLDPLARLRSRLIGDGVLDEATIGREQQAVEATVRDDLDRALAEASPEPSRYSTWMYG